VVEVKVIYVLITILPYLCYLHTAEIYRCRETCTMPGFLSSSGA
jgi:hypothetical protein